MRKVNVDKLYEWQIEEAFRAGKSKEMLPKILRVLSKKTGIKFHNQDADVLLPEEYMNSTGKYLGFMVFAVNSEEAIRFNFALEGDSERIVSIDYFSGPSNKPDYTIRIPSQFNIVQTLDHVAAVITGEYFDIMNEAIHLYTNRRLEERASHRDLIQGWLSQNEEVQQLMARRGGKDWDQLMDDYEDYLISQGVGSQMPAKTTFQIYTRQVFKEMGDSRTADGIPHVTVVRGQRETMINTDDQGEEVFENQIIQNEHLEKFDYMEWIFSEIQQGNKEYNGVYLYGQGGIGKSHTAEQMLKPLPNCTYFEGVIQGYTGLLDLLYKNRKDKIIVMDDTIDHKLMKNTTVQNILKLAMLPDPPNRIRVSKKAKTGDDSGVNVTGASMEEPPVSSTDLIDFTSDEGVLGGELEDSPEDFYFDSWVVFITNYPEVPQPISDRTEQIEFIFTNEQITDIIERALEGCPPKELDADTKKGALDWLRENLRAAGNATLSFRLFRKIANLYATAPPDKWEKWAVIKLRAAG